MLSLQDPTRVLKNLLGTSLKMYSTTGCSMSQKNTRLNWMHCRMGQFSFPKENRNCGWQKPRCSVHLHVEGPVIMIWPRHPEASHSLAPIQGIWSASHGCSETSNDVQRHVAFLQGAQSRRQPREQIGSSRQEARSLPVSLRFGILRGVGRN